MAKAALLQRAVAYDTPFGKSLIAITPRGICNLHFLDARDLDVEQTLRLEWKKAEILRDQKATQEINDRIFYFHQTTESSDKLLTLFVKGTNFQIQVWRALLQIPFAGITTYQTVAEAIARPNAARAVGNAVGNNPVAYLIPCHRVIRESGDLGGYHWGIERKAVILGWEASQMAYDLKETFS
jgi:AraC family transcriptional regulator, regulatory protein of adaptative response / methylated-DNA-[protein]-cysteine methyltransferase